MISIIVACDPRGVIGKENKLPWRCKKDLELFKEKTIGNVVIMGRKTWDSIPKKPLVGRANIIISRNTYVPYEDKEIFYFSTLQRAIDSVRGINCPGEKQCYFTLPSVMGLQKYKDKEIFIIGGGQIYQAALDSNLVDRVIMSKIRKEYDGDVKFPVLGNKWRAESLLAYDEFDLITYVKWQDPPEITKVVE